MNKKLLIIILIIIALVFCTSVYTLNATRVSEYHDYSCNEFTRQIDAQEFFEESGGNEEYDAYGLDRDSDGIACEYLPK